MKTAASLIGDIKESKVTDRKAVSAVFAGGAAIAAAAVTAAGIIASPFTAGATGVGGVVLAGYIIGAAIGTTVAVVTAAQATYNASENMQRYIETGNDVYLKAFYINIGLALFSIATAGMASGFGNMGA